MARMTDDMARLAAAIVAAREDRAAAAAQRREEVRARRGDSAAALVALEAGRTELAKAQRAAAAAEAAARRHQAVARSRQCRHAGAMRRRGFRADSAEARARTAAFMAGLTAQMAELRQSFRRDRDSRGEARRAMAHEVRHLLAGYAHQRHRMLSVWQHGLMMPMKPPPHGHARKQDAGAGRHGA